MFFTTKKQGLKNPQNESEVMTMENTTRTNRLTLDEQIKKHEDKLAELKARKAEAEKRANAAAEKEIMQHCRAYAAQHDLSLPDAADKIRDLLFGEQMHIDDLTNEQTTQIGQTAQAEQKKQTETAEHNKPMQQQQSKKKQQQNSPIEDMLYGGA